MGLSLFPALFERPVKVHFCEQEADENIELLLRQHWVTNLSWVITLLLGIAVPFLLSILSQSYNLALPVNLPEDIRLALIVLWYLFLLAFFIERFLHWYFNIYIVTDKHLVDINFHNLMNRDMVEVRIDDVQSAKSHVKGILGSLFHFGDVIIETAAERQQIQFLAVPKPTFVSDRIQDLHDIHEKGK